MSTNNPPFSTFTKLQVDIMASALAYAVRDTEDRIKEMLVNLRELSKDVPIDELATLIHRMTNSEMNKFFINREKEAWEDEKRLREAAEGNPN